MGETGFCKNLRFSAVSCENLRFPAVFCANLRLPSPLIYRASRKSAKICKNLRKCPFRVRFLPFAVSLLARPDKKWVSTPCLRTLTLNHRTKDATESKAVGCLRRSQNFGREQWSASPQNSVLNGSFCDRALPQPQGFPNMPFREVPFGFRRGTVPGPGATLLPVAPRMPKNKPKEAYLVPAPKARLYPKVLIAKCLPGGAEGPYQGQPLSPRKNFKKRTWTTRLEGTFECKGTFGKCRQPSVT